MGKLMQLILEDECAQMLPCTSALVLVIVPGTLLMLPILVNGPEKGPNTLDSSHST